MPNSKRTTNKKENIKKNKSRTRRNNVSHTVKLVLQVIIFVILLSITIGIFYFYHAYGRIILQLQSEAKQKVGTSTEDTFRAVETSLVYDSQGNLISTLNAEKDVYYLQFEEIPAEVINAMVVSEDRKFLEHSGVDYWANVRAAIALIKHKGKITQGASTITQQLSRNVFLTHKVTYERKIEEIFIAQELEKKYTKSEIMEYYLNEIYFANGHYGIQAAAQGYFGEGIKALSLSQKVFLCAIPNNPNLYNPVTNMDNTIKRRDRILLQMHNEGMISDAEYQEAISEEIVLHQSEEDKRNYVETYVYYSAIRALMKEKGFVFRYQFDNDEDRAAYDEEYDDLYYSCQKDLYVKGYRIYTSIDLEKQQLLQQSVDDVLKDFTEVTEEGVYEMQGAAVCIDNDTGRVVAIVGGREQDLAGYTLNRAYQSYRQPGSAIKPLIVYTPSFEREYTPASHVIDKYSKDGPRNAGNSYSGEITLQKAIEASKNTIAWKLFEELTPAIGLSYLLKMNFAKITDTDYVPAAALGGLTVGVSPVEMAAGYAAIENDGYYREPTSIVMITDADGGEVVGAADESKQIYRTNAARIMTEALTGVIKKGTAKGLGLSNTISAGKTGTTNDKKDGWFVGYTPYYTTSVWVGYDMPRTVDDLKGATYPGTIWHNFMEELHTPSMTKKFEYYDWRAVLKEQQEEEERKKAEEAALLTQAAEEETVDEVTEGEMTDISDDVDDETGLEDLSEGENQGSQDEDTDTDEIMDEEYTDDELTEDGSIDQEEESENDTSFEDETGDGGLTEDSSGTEENTGTDYNEGELSEEGSSDDQTQENTNTDSSNP